MKSIAYLLTFGLLISNITYSQHFHIDSEEDEAKVKKAVVAWADSVFYMHKEWKFENFHAFYTEEYEIGYLRTNAYKDRIKDLEKDKANGQYKKSTEEYEKEHKQLEDSYLKIKEDFENITVRATHYKISFWSNIQTNDGITVYYEHIVTLNNSYQVTDAEVNSAIGKKSDKTEIIFKKDVKKKVDKSDPNNQPPQNGGVTFTFENSDPDSNLETKEETVVPENETPKERKKRLKKESKALKKKEKEEKKLKKNK